MNLKYTICFLFYQDQVLLIERSKFPWIGKWNGLGGKIEPHESPLESIKREIQEEADITLQKEVITFSGVVSWIDSSTKEKIGMYAFLAQSDKKYFEEKEINEGKVKWQPKAFALDKNNTAIADNIPYFLPAMLKHRNPKNYFCVWENEKFKDVETYDLPPEILRQVQENKL